MFALDFCNFSVSAAGRSEPLPYGSTDRLYGFLRHCTMLEAGIERSEYPGDSHASDRRHWLRMTVLFGLIMTVLLVLARNTRPTDN